MRLLRPLILFITLLGIVFLLLNIQFTARRKRVIECDPEKIREIQIQNAGEIFALQRQEKGEWRLVDRENPDPYPVEKDVIEGFTILVCYLPYVDRFPMEGGVSQEEYGLESPSTRLTVFTDQAILIEVGGPTPTGTEFFVRSSLRPGEVSLVPNRHDKFLKLHFIEFRQRHPLLKWKGQQMQIIYEERELTLKGEGGSEEEQEFLSFLEGFHYENYHGPMTEEETEPYGFFLPDLEIRVADASYVLARFRGRYYLREKIGGDFYLYILGEREPKKLFEKLNEVSMDG